MIFMPAVSHVFMLLSSSIMFVASRHTTGLRPCFWAACCAANIGDLQTLPAANQFSLSATQKSLSLCVAIAYSGVMIMLSWSVSNKMPDSVRCCVMREMSGLLSELLSFNMSARMFSSTSGALAGVGAKVTSENTGAENDGAAVSSESSKSRLISKSVGSGKISVLSVGAGCVADCCVELFVAWAGIMAMR